MKKSIIILIAIIIVAVAAGVVFVLMHNANTGGAGNQGGQTGLLPPIATGTAGTGGSISSTLATAPTGPTFQIGTPQGSVTVNNIYKENDYITEDGQTIVVAQTSTYSIGYNVGDSGFIISLTYIQPGMPLQDARSAAENAFLQALGISKSDACKLNVQEGVSFKASPYYGQLMGLSFCGVGSAPGNDAGAAQSSSAQ